MEGERILQELKIENHLESLVERTTNYVSPLFHTEHPPCNKTLAKLEVFSLKLLKQCVERGKTSPASHHLSSLCHLAVSCLQVCGGASGKVPPLSFEKLLLHFAQLCLSHGDFSSAVDVCKQLRGRLAGKEEGGREEGREGDTLLKHAFDLVWKAALTVVQTAQDKTAQDKTAQDKTNAVPEDPCHVAADQCLDLREEAFSCLLTAREKNAVFAVDRIVKTSYHYLQLTTGRGRQCSMVAECYQRLEKFHRSLLALCDLPSLLPPSHSFLSVDYLCLMAKVASIAGHAHQAALSLAKAEEACPSIRDSGPHLPCVHLPSTLLHMSHMDPENEKRLCRVLQLVCGELRAWCEAGQGDTERVARWREAQLVKRTALLVDCLRRCGCHGDIMATLASTARVLPPRLLCEDGEGGEVMVEMWVRGKRDLDSGDLQQWKGRTLMSLLPLSHPPLSTKHRAHILNAEFTRYTDQGSPDHIAAGKELIDVYREGGREWDLERGRVMVAIATTDSSLLDEALEVLGGVEGSSYHTPSHRHQVLLHLASAHTLKAIAVLQDKMGSCDVDVGSRDPVSESCDQGSRAVDKCVSLSDEQCKALYDGEVEKHLVWGVEKWCQWGEGEGEEEGEKEGEGEKIFYFLHLTAELCVVTRKFELALKSLGFLLNIYQLTPSLTASYQSALATYCQLGVREGADICWGTMERRLLGAVRGEVGEKGRGGRSTSHLTTSYLKCRLALATLYLHRGEVDRGRTELVGLFRDPMLSRHTLSAHTLTAGTKITTARLLQTRHTPIIPMKQFLTQLLTDQSTPPEGKAVCDVTSVELVSSAVKTLTSLVHRCGPLPEGGGGREGLSSGPGSWETLNQLLDGLLQLSSLHLRQAAVREALYYAREGAALARKVALAAWYTEFCWLLARIHRTKGDTEAAEAATCSLSPLPSPPSPSSCDKLHAALTEAEAELALNHPSKALTLCSDAINDSSSSRCDVDVDLALAGLHLVAGKAAVQEVALTRPVLMEELWGQARGRGRERGRTGCKRGVLGWLTLVPKPFQQALSHFCTSLQLCYPSCPPPLLREVYQCLSVVLSPYHPLLAAHCLLHSFHLSLGHQAATTLAKKIQKCPPQDCNHPFHNILVTLQDTSEVCPASSDPLVLARAVLRPSISPPSLSVTSSLLSALPEGCQFTAICLSPSTTLSQGEEDHLLVCAVGKNREPVFVKTVIDGRTMLEEFSSLLTESEASMQLSEKRAWWGTRRRLDRRIKEVVNCIQSEWLGDYADVLVPPAPSSETTTYHLLCVGRRLQHLPWESIPVLQGQPVARSPSLTFSVAHQILQTTQRSSVDPEKGYFVLNPRGDLPATEKRFHGWFEEELGWTGVVGCAPTSNQFSEALEDHDVFVYCGHGTGKEFLATDHFQLLGCQATTLLMGCGSGRLVVGGVCDPAGMALTYLLAGCPSLVAVLWDVTDGDIDKLSRALLEEWLEQREGERVLLGQALATARSVCKLEGLNGYAAVMYGDPSSAVVR